MKRQRVRFSVDHSSEDDCLTKYNIALCRDIVEKELDVIGYPVAELGCNLDYPPLGCSTDCENCKADCLWRV